VWKVGVLGSSARKTILCVEDEEQQLKLRKILFEDAGFEVLVAQTGNEALDLFRQHEVDGVVLDYWMSGMNGLAVAREMKRTRPGTPIIVVSGFTSLPGETIGLVDAWFQKSKIEPEDLVKEVKALVRFPQHASP
jgi:two-component system copper resistance phosphate regulon response regulator CusR